MGHFSVEQLLAARTSAADEGAIGRMAQRSRDLRARGQDIVSLTLGEPDFDTPLHIQEAATAAMAAGFTHYSPVQGLSELRQALARKFKAENGLDYDAAEISVGNGAKQVIVNAVMSLVEPGDEVIMLAPFWVSYAITVKLAGGTPIVLPASVAEGYKTPASRIAAALTQKTKLLMLNSPCNPSGALWSATEFAEIARLVADHPRLLVLSDEIYEYIVFNGKFSSFAAQPGMRERTITVNGFSKGFAMTGWRLGYAGAPAAITRAMTVMQSNSTAGVNPFVQRAGIAALEGSRDEVERMRLRYQARRDMVLAALRAMPGIGIGDIPATFYAFPDVSALLGRKAGNHVLDTSDRLCDWLLDEHGVATVPGTAFGAPNSIRLSFAASEADIEKALARLARAFARLS